MQDIIQKSKILAIRDIQIALYKASADGNIIPDIVFATIQNVEDIYLKEDNQ